MDNKQLVEEALFYINNKCTIKEVADNFNLSKKTVQNHFKKLEEVLGNDDDLIIAINKVRKDNELNGKILGGETGKRGPSYSEEDLQYARELRESSDGYSYRNLEYLTGISKSTLNERIGKK